MIAMAPQTHKRTSIHVAAEDFICNHPYMMSAIRVGQVLSISDVTVVEALRIGMKKRFKFECCPPIYRCT
jgi:hypothetical protein